MEYLTKKIADGFDASLFSTTSTATLEEPRPFKARDLWKCKLQMLGLEIRESEFLPDNCILLCGKNSKDIAWFNIDTKKIYYIEHEALMKDLWGDAYDLFVERENSEGAPKEAGGS